MGTATEARYEYRGTEPFSNKRKKALPQKGLAAKRLRSRHTRYVLYEFSRYPGSASLIQPIPVFEETKKEFCILFPDFPGCVSCGRTREKALQMGREALELHLAGMDDDDSIPLQSAKRSGKSCLMG